MAKITIEEYLKIERSASFKSEYYKGQMRPLHPDEYVKNYFWKNQDANPENHEIILSKLITILRCVIDEKHYNLEANAYQVYISEILPEHVTSAATHQFTNLYVLFEIFSPSINDYDYGGTFDLMRSNKTLAQYVNIYSESIVLENHHRSPNNNWLVSTHRSLDDQFMIEKIGYEMKLTDLYDGLSFPV